ncbi:hypothetical protein BJF79_17760 [Actinomadura sp. CNU-125]|uniref:hypothetical protein n=1 Tax=Actinomadura sp. CNU-125 TaxID=1904961 RepID=UPI00096045C9|nr:hypothetical protein [Actinomadura sp. CNU-125]OLT17399.1 hypothetical protein BJF79_17760 [Actinomadura sp. CNU-125]
MRPKNLALRVTVILAGVAFISASVYYSVFRVGGDDGDGRPAKASLGEPRSDGRPITFPGGALAREVAPLGAWPAACALLTEPEIESVLPHVDELKVDEVTTWPPGTSATALEGEDTANTRCGYSMRLPSETSATTALRVDIKRVGAPASNLDYFRTDVHAIPYPAKEIAGARCGPTSLLFPEVACVKGGIVFSVLAYSGAVFEGHDEPGPVMWRDEVLPRLAEVIAADVRT